MTKTRRLQILVTAFTLSVLALGVAGVSASVVASPVDPTDLGQSLVNALTGVHIDDPAAMLTARITLGAAAVAAITGWIVVAVLLKRARLELSQIWRHDAEPRPGDHGEEQN
jgi:hypothetical protein